jgi:hypothetical protein
VQVDPIKPTLKAPGSERLKLKCGDLLSKNCYKCNLLRYNPASSFERSVWPVIGPLLPNIPGELYSGLPYVIAPVLMDPNRLAGWCRFTL